MTKPIGLTELGATSLRVETGEQNMTHDELLTNCKPDSALYSMVIRHRPTEPTLLGNVYCHECIRVEGIEKAHYPCPTIQTIDKELK